MKYEDLMKAGREASERKLKELKEAAMPLIKYLNENHNPHTIAIVGPTSVEILSGEASIPDIYDHVKD